MTSHKKCGIIITEGKGKTPTNKPNLSVANYLSVGEMENTMATFKTEREFLTAIVNGEFKPEFVEFAKGRIAALDKKNADRKVSKSALAHKAENDNLKGAILAVLVAAEGFCTGSSACGDWRSHRLRCSREGQGQGEGLHPRRP